MYKNIPTFASKQNVIVMINTERNIISNLFHFVDGAILAKIIRRFQTPTQNFDFGLSKLKFYTKLLKFYIAVT